MFRTLFNNSNFINKIEEISHLSNYQRKEKRVEIKEFDNHFIKIEREEGPLYDKYHLHDFSKSGMKIIASNENISFKKDDRINLSFLLDDVDFDEKEDFKLLHKMGNNSFICRGVDKINQAICLEKESVA